MPFQVPVFDNSIAPPASLVEAKIRAAGWWPKAENTEQVEATELAAQIAVEGATARFLRIVKWRPFVSSGQSETRYFSHVDAEGRINMGNGLLSLESVSISRRAYLTAGPNPNVFPIPANAEAEGVAYRALQLWTSHFGGWDRSYGPSNRARELRPNSIEVTGIWGEFSDWPEDAVEAIVTRAAGAVLAMANTPQDLQSVSVDGFMESYDLVGPVDPKTALTLLTSESRFMEVARAYIKPSPRAQTISTSINARAAQRFFPSA